jgi:acyl carrier protein
MINQDEAISIIIKAFEALNDELPDENRVEVTLATPLFGTDATIDSLALVSLIVDVESALSERLGRPVVLTDDRAMGRAVVPFTSVQTLADYAVELGKE